MSSIHLYIDKYLTYKLNKWRALDIWHYFSRTQMVIFGKIKINTRLAPLFDYGLKQVMSSSSENPDRSGYKEEINNRMEE